jgi:hypothetical protein
LLSGDALQPSRRERVLHQLGDAIVVERYDKRQIELTGKVVNSADGGHNHAASVAVAQLQHRYPEIQVLIVSPGNDFIFAEREDGPDADILPDDISILDTGI